MYSIELNPMKWTLAHFSPTRIKEYWKEKAKENELFQSFASDVRQITHGNKYYLEIDPNKWEKEDFSAKNITGFLAEKFNKTPIISTIIPVGRYFAKYIEPRNNDIKNLSKKEASYVKFAYNTTLNAKYGKAINDNYKLITHDKSQKEENGFEVFIQRSEKAKRTIISYKDTDDLKDIESDYQLAKGEKPNQLEPAIKTYRKILEKYPNDEIIITGFSLGGSLTELVCSSPEAKKHGKTKGFSFNGYGVDSNLSACGTDYQDLGNVICVNSSSDIIVGNGSHHVGREYILPVEFDIIGFHGLATMKKGIQNLKTDNSIFAKLFKPANEKKDRVFAKDTSPQKSNLKIKINKFTNYFSNSIKKFFS